MRHATNSINTRGGIRPRCLWRLVRRIWPKDPRRSAFASRIRCSRQKRDVATQAHDRDFYQHQAATWLSMSRIVCLPNDQDQTVSPKL